MRTYVENVALRGPRMIPVRGGRVVRVVRTVETDRSPWTGQPIQPTDEDLESIRGRTVAVRTAYGTRVGRLGLGVEAGEVRWSVVGLCFCALAVTRIVNPRGPLPVVVVGGEAR